MIGSEPRARGRLRVVFVMALALPLLSFGPPAAASSDPVAGIATTPSLDRRDLGRDAPVQPDGDPGPVVASPRRTDPTLAGEADPEADVLLAPPYKVTAYTIRTLAPSALPYVSTVLPDKEPRATRDEDGVPMKLVGTHLYYSPAGLAQYGLMYEDAYRRNGDPDYLAIASKVLNKLLALGVLSNGAAYIPYRFNFAMHGISTEVMRAPWYSAMAQGLALSLAVRLYRDTANPVYKTDADMLFKSFKHVGRGTNPWVTYIDSGRYLWLEEYPEPTTPSDHTANGFNFAVFGLYDYYQETHDPYALQVLRASLTTMRHYISSYRRPGTYSKYCLRHGKPQAKYHKIVTWQLEFLYKMSGDTYFHSMSRLFASDYR